MLEVMGSNMTNSIYVELIDEGVRVWRPVPAQHISGNIFKILDDESYDPSVETWKFPPGSLVMCAVQHSKEGEFMAAVELANKSM